MKNLILFLTVFLMTGMVYGQTTTFIGPSASSGTDVGNGGNYCSFFGLKAGNVNSGTHNTFIGVNSGRDNTNGSFNVFMGLSAGRFNKLGSYNTFLGNSTGYKNTTGVNNIFLGSSAGYSNTTGARNTFVGTDAGKASTDGYDNTYIGYKAGENATGKRNVFIGYNAGLTAQGVDDKLYIDNNVDNDGIPLIYGDFGDEYVGIAIDPSNVVNPSEYALYLGKGMLAQKVKVALKTSGDWSDYVFETDYKRNSLEEVDDFVKKNKHLPNVPSATDVYKNGIDLGQMDATLLRQIEELWLHMIDMKKENQVLKEEIKTLKEK